MTNYVIRVELYGTPSEEVYKKLHQAMGTKYFFRSFTEANKNLMLPTAMYYAANRSEYTLQIVELAKQAASTVWIDFAVVAIPVFGRFEFYNLKSA